MSFIEYNSEGDDERDEAINNNSKYVKLKKLMQGSDGDNKDGNGDENEEKDKRHRAI